MRTLFAPRPSGTMVHQGWHGLESPELPQATLLTRPLRLEVVQNLGQSSHFAATLTNAPQRPGIFCDTNPETGLFPQLRKTSEPRFYGRVSCLHAGGIDRPLSIWKEGVGSVRPHQNWRGQFARGTWGTWGAGPLQGRSSDCTYAGAPDCIPLHWPGYRTNAWHQQSPAGDSEYWMGSLVDGMRDVTGQIYMRNRYYDPATGQFTQPDPIGIAGGLNSYGFAAGDPVTYSDPYGLKVCYQGTQQERSDLVKATEQATNTTITLDKKNCIATAVPNKKGQNPSFRSLQRRLNALISDSRVVTVVMDSDAPESNYFNNRVTINSRDFSASYNTNTGFLCHLSPIRNGQHSAGSIMAHELLGHAGAPLLKRYLQSRAIDVENEYHAAAANESPRCRSDP